MKPHPNAYYSSSLGVFAYDLFVGQGLLSGDVDFYLDCAECYDGPILEPGCGTGRITLPLADAGHDIVRLDVSDAMLRLAKQKAKDRRQNRGQLRFIAADMTSLNLKELFGLAIVPARSFRHITTPSLQRAALECIHRHLLPGERLVLDLFDANFDFLFGTDEIAPPARERRDPATDNLVRRTVVGRHVDLLDQAIREDLCFEVVDAAGLCTEREETSWTSRWSMRQEMEYLFELVGFKMLELYSDFQRSPPAYGRKQLWIAEAL